MPTVVITGSTRGLGHGLAGALLQSGCQVVVSGRTSDAVDAAVEDLARESPASHVLGQPADVSDPAQVEALWAAAEGRFGRVDIWVNNAGLALADRPLWEVPAGDSRRVVDTNLTGLLYGCQVAARGMLAQGSGTIFNLEGFGSTGMVRRGLLVYGSTKAAVHYVTKALAAELAHTPVRVVSLAPGMVMTDLVMGQYAGRPADWQRARRVFNIIGESVETIAPWLAQHILANPPNGARVSYLSPPRLLWRFVTAPLSRRNIFEGLKEPE